jgi:hypothetical protein
MTTGKCDMCEKESKQLQLMLYSDGEKLMLCPSCFDHEEMRADYAEQRWKEEHYEE